MLSSGTCAIIEAIQVEELEKPETTYNFEVADFHTYYVAESNILVHNDCFDAEFEAWLNEGESDYTVYKGVNQSGDEVYTGITKQKLSTRKYQHNHPSKKYLAKHPDEIGGKNFSMLRAKHTGLTKNQARAIETHLIKTDGHSQLNKILSIRESHRFSNAAEKWAIKYLTGGI